MIQKFRKILGEKQTVRHKLWTSLGITLLAFALSWIVAQPFSFSMSTLLASQDKKDFNNTDFYNIVANSRPVRTLETEVVIVNIDNADRDDIIDLLNILSIMEPKAVGLDVTFNEQRDGDTLLIDAIDAVPNMVLASTLSKSGGVICPDDNSWFYNETYNEYNYGIVNLPSKFEGATIRQFPLWIADNNGEKKPSFALAIASQIDPQVIEEISVRGHEFEIIDFPSHEFTVIDWYDVPDHPEAIEGKIVLIGATGDTSDIHATPIEGQMTGVTIHAYAICTLLHGRYYDTVPKWINILVAGLICILMTFISLIITTPIKGVVLRLVQVIMLYLTLRVGYSLFVDNRIIMDFSYSILMLAFVFFASDVWNGSIYLYNIIRNKICHK